MRSGDAEFKRRYLAAEPGSFVPCREDQEHGISILKPPPIPLANLEAIEKLTPEEKKNIRYIVDKLSDYMKNPFGL